MLKDDFINILKENNPSKMMEFLLSNGKKPKSISPFRYLSDEEMEEFKNGKNERIDGRD